VLVGRALFGALALLATGSAVAPGQPRARDDLPNILFIMTDDLAWPELAAMPRTLDLIGDRGATFERYLVNVSLCCPSRVTTLRGQYAHNTGIRKNSGYPRFAFGLEADTIATRLQSAGYRTALFGKYLNGYADLGTSGFVPPGWDAWASPVAGDEYGQYDYVLNEDGVLRSYGHRDQDYGTSVYLRHARRFIEDANRDHEPFFAFVSLYAPHSPATPAPRDFDGVPRARAPRTPSFDQADVSRMPSYIRELPRLSPQEKSAIDWLARRRVQSLQAVDRGVASLVALLEDKRLIDDTYIVFTSDNGFHLGEHRLPAGKQTPYDSDVRVPLLVRGPGVAPDATVDALAANIDLAPTFAAMAGIEPPAYADGRSLLPLARGRLTSWRSAVLIEHVASPGQCPPGIEVCPGVLPGPATSGAAVERRPDFPAVLERRPGIPAYTAIRTQRYLYVRYATGERELYDVRRDPDEIHNLAGQRERLERELQARLAGLRDCQARTCRSAEQLPLP